MKKVKNKVANSKRAAKKGRKESERRKLVKLKIAKKRKLEESLKAKQEKEWNDYYKSLVSQ
jgi:hypothetical protein